MMVRMIDRTPAWFLWVFCTIMAGVLTWTVIHQVRDDARQDGVVAGLTAAQAGQAAKVTALEQANETLRAHGLPTVPVPTTQPAGTGGVVVPPPVVITQQAVVPTSLVSNAVARYCTGARCKGTPTRADVQAAVTAYCASGACAGVRGQDAPPLSDQAVSDAVAAYCGSHNSCAGPAGADSTVAGPQGPTGPDGRGISAAACSALLPGFSMIFTFTDGTTQTVECTDATTTTSGPTDGATP